MERGVQTFAYPPPPDSSQLYANVEFAVYAPGTFTNTFGSWFTFPTGLSTQYIYAYEVFNNLPDHPWPVPSERDYVLWTTVGILANSAAGSAGSCIPTPLSKTRPSTPCRTPPCRQSGGSAVARPTLNYGGVSDVLYFASPYGPSASPMTALVSGNLSDTEYMPSPMPEPATLTLLALGLGSVWMRRRRTLK